MPSIAKKPTATGAEFARLWDDYMAKRRLWSKTGKARTRNGLDHPLYEQRGQEAEAAFQLAYAAFSEFAGSDDDNLACAVILPDGRYLVFLSNELDQIGDQWAQLQCVEPANVVNLS
jgi:hypothetical protein